MPYLDLLLGLVLQATHPTPPQQPPENAAPEPPSESSNVDSYLCTFSESCAEEPGEVEEPVEEKATVKPEPKTQGFSLARPVGAMGAFSLAGSNLELRVPFGPGSAELSQDARTKATSFAKALLSPELRSLVFDVRGHTNTSGSPAANLRLSTLRAQAVADYLIEQGVEPHHLTVTGYGARMPLANRAPDAEENQRVEVVLQRIR